MGAVRLNVADLDRARRFYEQAIGLRRPRSRRGSRPPGVGRGAAVVELAGRPDAPRRPPGTTGLFHLAILVPSRAELARTLRRVADAGWRLTGASDHLVSEALYLHDPEGNGIEIYRDRPREQWRYVDGAAADGHAAARPRRRARRAAGRRQRGDRACPPKRGSGTSTSTWPSSPRPRTSTPARWASRSPSAATPGRCSSPAGGYHHHVGVNTWAGEGAAAPPPGSLGPALVRDRARGRRAAASRPGSAFAPRGSRFRTTRRACGWPIPRATASCSPPAPSGSDG